eukprot:gnl/MRDRNA2_/MRDRNA2_19925_c0_seq1.p1 gnl/MRDRNA2_/MRDRNA2_19925_c0~~gnl/MRDRNA2_/MRDRNA2_19925_c0_seq1.p1  ORF type:complete len:848 (-),score=172.37 gnl/MRDRNA2_/MRDRNA2_19925_c0_seq1:149-2638(-)
MTQAEIDAKLKTLLWPPPGVPEADWNNGTFDKIMAAQFHMEEGFGKGGSIKSKMTRSLIPFGLPLKGYRDMSEKTFEQESEIGTFTLKLSDILDTNLEFLEDQGLQTFYLGGPEVLQKQVNERTAADSLFALFSLIFVWAYALFHLRSVFLACVGMLMVVFAFPVAVFINREIFQLAYFDLLNVLLIYLLLGIGADDLFITMDAWKQSNLMTDEELGLEDPDNTKKTERLSRRMSYTIARAGHAMLATSLTTGGAFLANASSGIAPTAQFGIFACTMIMVLYGLAVVCFPAAILVHEFYLNYRGCCSPCGCKGCCDCECCNKGEKEKRDVAVAALKTNAWTLDNYSAVEKWFYNKAGPFIIVRKKIFIGVFLVITFTMVALAAQIKSATESPTWLPDDDPLQELINRLQCSSAADFCFSGNTNEAGNINAVMMWGVGPEPDRQGFSKFDHFTIKCENAPCGTNTWDKSFDLKQPEVQQYIYDMCLHGAKLKSVNLGIIQHCVMKDFKEFVEANGFEFPVPAEYFNQGFRMFMDYEMLDPKRNITFQPFKMTYLESKMVAFPKDQDVMYVMVAWQTKFKRQTLYPQDEMWGCYDEFMAFEEHAGKAAPAGGGKPFVTTEKGHGFFLIAKIAKEFEDSVIRGILISLSIALVILIVATGNWLIGVLALWTIGSITAFTIGMMFIYGWELGIIEAICSVLVVGFSVDYAVHYGISYSERKEHTGTYNLGDTRDDKTLHSFFELGTSVVGGAMTTFGASVFLFCCKQTFFKVFGIFLCTVIVGSFLFANFSFMPMLAQIGPQKGMGTMPWHTHRRNSKEVVPLNNNGEPKAES